MDYCVQRRSGVLVSTVTTTEFQTCHNYHICLNTTTSVTRAVDGQGGRTWQPLCASCAHHFGQFLHIVHFFGWYACDNPHCASREAIMVREPACGHHLCRACFVHQTRHAESCLACSS